MFEVNQDLQTKVTSKNWLETPKIYLWMEEGTTFSNLVKNNLIMYVFV